MPKHQIREEVPVTQLEFVEAVNDRLSDVDPTLVPSNGEYIPTPTTMPTENAIEVEEAIPELEEL